MANATLQRIDAKLDQLDPESLRYRILVSLRQFRAGWIDLGRMLNQVALDGDYKEWGYDDFDVYCARELGLKRPTVQKLMVSYNYMRKHEPDRLGDFEDAPTPAARAAAMDLPDFQTVELLDRARRRADDGRADLDQDTLEDYHRRVFRHPTAVDGEDASSTDYDADAEEARVRKELRERLRPTPPTGDAAVTRERAGLLRLARTMRQRLAASPNLVPDNLRHRLEDALAELEDLP